ncbi:MAG: hypothetical protein ACJAUB_002776 [Cryomorphaceae bacterium]|jgi:hypothetical protein
MKPQEVSKDYPAACFLFGDDRASFPLNNVNYPNAGLDTPYRSKAMINRRKAYVPTKCFSI